MARATLKNTKCGCDDRTLEEIAADVLDQIRVAYRTGVPLLFADLCKLHGWHTATQVLWKLDEDGFDVMTGDETKKPPRREPRG